MNLKTLATILDPDNSPYFQADALPISSLSKPLPLTSITASAKRLTSKRLKGNRARGGSAGWQDDAWEMYDQVGEQRFLATTLAGRMSQARFYVGTLDQATQTDAPQEVDDKVAKDVLESIGTNAVGLAQMISRLAVNLFIAGDGWFVGVPHSKMPEYEQSPGEFEGNLSDGNIHLNDLEWHMLSVSEVTFQDTKVQMKIGSDGEEIELDADDIYLIRIWRPHPRRAWEADSPTRSSLPVLRELVGLTMHISAQVDSRLAGAGVFLVPQSADDAIKSKLNDDDDEGSNDDVFTEALMDAMITPISDRSSASAVVPLVVTAPDDSIDKFRHIEFSSALDDEARELRDEAIRRLALGQDAPPELLLGTAGMNHWGAWLIREDVVSTHLEPTLALICDALTTQYLRPVLAEMGYSDEELENLVVWYDVSHMISRPNRGTEALTLFESGAISDATLREANGFDENDAPEISAVTDPSVEIALEAVGRAPSLLSSPGLPELVRQIREVLGSDDGAASVLPDLLGDEATSRDAETVSGTPPNTDSDDAVLPEFSNNGRKHV